MLYFNFISVSTIAMLVFINCVGASSFVEAQTAATEQHVQITLRESTVVEQETIRLGHVASITCESEELAQRIAQLDLHELRGNGEVVISKSHVQIRLLLWGLGREQFDISGADSVTVHSLAAANNTPIIDANENASANAVEAMKAAVAFAIKDRTSQVFSIHIEDVIVKLNDSHNRRVLQQFSESESAQLHFELLGGGREALGNRRLRFAVRRGKDSQSIHYLSAETSIIVPMPIATSAINSGDIFSSDNVTFQASETSLPPFELLNESKLFGKTASRPIAVGSAISHKSIQSQATANAARTDGRTQKVVKARDAVSVVAKVGGVSVRLNNATAMQAGGTGDVISVRNEGSQKIIKCRVIAANQVEAMALR